MDNLTVVVAIIIDSEGKVLLQKRNDPEFPEAHGKWEFPGGGVDNDKTKEDALQRECIEEIGCSVIIERLLPKSQKRTWISVTGKQVATEVYGYQCGLAPDSEPKPSNEEVQEIRWFTREEVKGLEVVPGTLEFLAQA
ncbi:MAG: hypothetical protein A3K06_00225 [Candidatus Doudnabacteria bacterium RIFCSPHIGHO2_01_52_17]|uniref:Nudix hydrolase domain-containing protein n=1 Tax=Candidatus Doudnabacteria bacterium RIFCSPHIGHO2_01_52_17 TaxID=1817820 RepID=A0A1F5NEZ9_9BACT|nr:MAG: hypothetical protein A3K06_00225 [Candidatus Doudnabacteria bacterium RIFCSPHIGHO2_01_52_17]